jgi:ATP-dependent DNA helicase RecQ
VCTGQVPLERAAPETVRAALTHLRAQTVVIEPRKMWPAGAPRRGKIAESARAEPGRALALAEDPAWLELVSAALRADAPVPAEVFDGVVGLLSRWGWPAGRPSWVTWVPSRAHGTLLADLAQRLAALGRMTVAAPLRADGAGLQSDAATNVESARLALNRLSVGDAVPSGPVLLLDDTMRSGFTLTTAAVLLREAGSGPVYPLVLHKTF